MQIRRGDVWWVDFSSSKPAGGEIKKIRPAVVVSNDMSNKVMNREQVMPLTSQIEKCYPCEAYVKVDGKQSKAMADQIMTISKTRLSKRMGKIEISDLTDVERAIKIQLDLQ